MNRLFRVLQDPKTRFFDLVKLSQNWLNYWSARDLLANFGSYQCTRKGWDHNYEIQSNRYTFEFAWIFDQIILQLYNVWPINLTTLQLFSPSINCLIVCLSFDCVSMKAVYPYEISPVCVVKRSRGWWPVDGLWQVTMHRFRCSVSLMMTRRWIVTVRRGVHFWI